MQDIMGSVFGQTQQLQNLWYATEWIHSDFFFPKYCHFFFPLNWATNMNSNESFYFPDFT